MKNASPQVAAVPENPLQIKQEEEESSSQQQHENMMNDNLGRIAKNIARNYAKNSKRMSAGSNQPNNSASQIMMSSNWQQGKGMNTIKLEQPPALAGKKSPASADKMSQVSS